MKLSDIKTLPDVAIESGISRKALLRRLNAEFRHMVEGEDYRLLGERMPVLLSPDGVKKILKMRQDHTQCTKKD